MAVLQIPSGNHANLRVDELVQSLRRFRVVVEESASFDRIKRLADEKLPQIEGRQRVMASLHPHTSIWHEMAYFFSTGERPSWDVYHAHFLYYAHYWVSLWDSASAPEREKLLGWLKGGLQTGRDFASQYFELMVGFLYASIGSAVEAVDLAERGGKGYDYDVRKLWIDYCVEVKTVEYTSGYPFDGEWMGRAAIIVMEAIKGRFPGWKGCKVEVDFIGRRAPTHKALMDEARLLSNALKHDCPQARGQLLDITVNASDYDGSVEAGQAIAGGDRRADRFVSYLFGPEGEQPIYVEIGTNLEWRLPEAVGRVMKAAVGEQLPQDKRAVLWIQLVGASAAMGNTREAVMNLLNSGQIIPEIKKRQQGLKPGAGLVGVHLCGDPYAAASEDGTVLHLHFTGGFVSAQPMGKELELYRNLMLLSFPRVDW